MSINAQQPKIIEKIPNGMDFTGAEFNRRLRDFVDQNFRIRDIEIQRAIVDVRGLSPITALLNDVLALQRKTRPVVNSIHVGVQIAGHGGESPIAWQAWNFRNPHGGDVKSWATGVGPSGYATISGEWLHTMFAGMPRDNHAATPPEWNRLYGGTWRSAPRFYKLPTKAGTVNGIDASGFQSAPLARFHESDVHLVTRHWGRAAIDRVVSAWRTIVGAVSSWKYGNHAPHQHVVSLGKDWVMVLGRASRAVQYGSYGVGRERLVSICGSQVNMDNYPFAGEVYTIACGAYGDGHNYGAEVSAESSWGGRPALKIRVNPEGSNSGDFSSFDVFYMLLGRRDNSVAKQSALHNYFR